MTAPLFTVGYEGSTVDAVLALLRRAGVGLLLDVRAVPLSRKPGFSKRALAAAADATGLRYVHLRDLGTPKDGRIAARRGHAAALDRIYGAHLETEAAALALADATALAAGAAPVCLLCFEADPACCHRRLLAERLSAGRRAVRHLRVVP